MAWGGSVEGVWDELVFRQKVLMTRREGI